MKNTAYKNPEGLTTPGHTTTARDLSILATHIVQDFPEYLHYYSIKKYRYEGTPTANDTNRNMLLFRDPTVDGLKTGHTDAAGYCLIATAKRDLRAGEMLDGEGGYTVFGKLFPARKSLALGSLPLGLAHNLKLVRPVAKDQSLTWADVVVDETLPAYRIRKEMETVFAGRSQS